MMSVVRETKGALAAAALVVLFGCGPAASDGAVSQLAVVEQSLTAELVADVATNVLPNYDDAPRTPDADDPAIWVGPEGGGLVIVALKDAGLAVYDLQGALVQSILPPNRPPVSAEDPPTVGAVPDPGTSACSESESGETFGRFNNVDVQYGLPLTLTNGKRRKVDVAVVTDRGCDRLRIYEIDTSRAGGPLFDITAPDAPRVFPQRYVNPWTLLGTAESTLEDNPLDDQSTAYGLTLYRKSAARLRVFVTQRSRSNLAEIELFDTGRGALSYQRIREYRFSPVFKLPGEDGKPFRWTPCREDAADDPQFEGLVVDQENHVLYAAQEVVGIWKLPLDVPQARVVEVSPQRLVEPVKSFGAGYWAVPDDGEYSCEDEAPAALPEGTLVQSGNPALAGDNLEADAEGLAIYYGHGPRRGYLIASSQGDDTFHVYERIGGFTRAHGNEHLGSFTIDGAGETDGHEVVNAPMGARFPRGLFVAQNGKAEEPENTDPINGYDFDGATQFLYLGWEDVALPLGLDVAPRGHDPRR